ncbi:MULTISPECIES: trypsin-like serine peptidase [Actinomadura]|uniref:Trypsin-like serine peptidase n=3 Tax=Actinomadura yumaensis TaxID=111807 RepID=A0ABW2CJE2_9ACTN|nr:trypsin-like serine protease [Actinomadura sp. J1-007]MWK33143.1 trypsin-like serine protease [Actinomadura sp. J1-007]
MHRGRKWWTVVLGTSAGVVAAGAGTVWLSSGDGAEKRVVDTSASVRISAADSNEAARYWTAKRMAAAKPVGRAEAPGGAARTQAAAQAVPRSTAFHGIPTLGALFFNNGSGDHYCTASVVHSYSKKLLITAAHCIHGGRGAGYVSKVAFVPKYEKGKRPYGTWTAKMLLVDQRWASKSDPDLDFGFIGLNPLKGKTIEAAVGYNMLGVNQGVGKYVNVTGYPRIAYDKRDQPIYCRAKTARQSKYQVRMDCSGFYGGTSGSPWLLKYNGKTHTGYINGVIGGYQGGGNTHWRSFSPYFDNDVNVLRSAADKRA